MSEPDDGRCPNCGEDEMDGARCYYCGFHDYNCGLCDECRALPPSEGSMTAFLTDMEKG